MSLPACNPPAPAVAFAPDTLVQFVYSSRAWREVPPAALATLLAHCRHAERHHGLTGALLVHRGEILHALEGPWASVGGVFALIGRDARHYGVAQEHLAAVAGRSWPRHYVAATGCGLPGAVGLSTAGWETFCLSPRATTPALALLESRWQACPAEPEHAMPPTLPPRPVTQPMARAGGARRA